MIILVWFISYSISFAFIHCSNIYNNYIHIHIFIFIWLYSYIIMNMNIIINYRLACIWRKQWINIYTCKYYIIYNIRVITQQFIQFFENLLHFLRRSTRRLSIKFSSITLFSANRMHDRKQGPSTFDRRKFRDSVAHTLKVFPASDTSLSNLTSSLAVLEHFRLNVLVCLVRLAKSPSTMNRTSCCFAVVPEHGN